MARLTLHWLGQADQNASRLLLQNMRQSGFDVLAFSTLNALLDTANERRPGVIVLSDTLGHNETLIAITELASNPQLKGARLILARDTGNDIACEYAMIHSFRDIISSHLSFIEWKRRLDRAISSHPVPYSAPNPRITIDDKALVSVPARVICGSAAHIRLETRIMPNPGDTLTLEGPLAVAMGHSRMTLVVERLESEKLYYRLASAITCSWSPNSNQEANSASTKLLSRLHTDSPGYVARVFVVAETPELRGKVIRSLRSPQIDVTAAFRKQSIISDPRYITPDAVFIETSFFRPERVEPIRAMLATLAPTLPVILIGSSNSYDYNQAALILGSRPIHNLEKIPGNLAHILLGTIVPPSSRTLGSGEQTFSLHTTERFSLARLSVSARLAEVHPNHLKLTLPCPVANFSLVKVQSPTLKKCLGRSPFLKILSSYPSGHQELGQFGYAIEGQISDSVSSDQSQIVKLIQSSISSSFAALNEEVSQANSTSQISNKSEINGASGSNSTANPNSGFTNAGPAAASKPAILQGNAAANLDPVNDFLDFGEVRISIPATATLPETAQEDVVEIGEAEEEDNTDYAGEWRKLREIQKKNQPKFYASKSMLRIVVFILVTSALLGTLFWIAAEIAPEFEKDGKVYTEQLYKFAPKLKKTEDP